MQVVLEVLECRHGGEDARTAGAFTAGHQVGQHVDGRAHSRQELVGERAEFEALRHDVGRREQLVGMQALQQVG